MTKEERKLELIENLESTISNGGESSTISKLKTILDKVKNGTHSVEKRRGRKPSKKNESK